MKKNEIVELCKLIGRCGYNYEAQKRFKSLSVKLLREINSQLSLNADVRFNKAGIATTGDAILHAENVYVMLNPTGICNWILYRTCKGKRDYTGGTNRQYTFERLARDNYYDGPDVAIGNLCKAIAAILPHTHECPTCGDVLTCNNPRCEHPLDRKLTCGAHTA